MNRLLIPILLMMASGQPAARAADGPMVEPAARAWAVAEVVMARHVDPPTRSQMLLAGIKAMAASAKVATPGDLARRVSDLTTPDQLAPLLAEVLAGPKAEPRPTPPDSVSVEAMFLDAASPEEAFFFGLLSVVSGGATLMSEKERKVQESFEANLYVGLQVQLGFDDATKRPSFMGIFSGGPADNAGVKVGDLIEEVSGESTLDLPLAKLVDLLRGAEGTDVVIRYKRPSTGEVFTKPMTRARLPHPTIEGVKSLPGKRWAVRLDGPAPIGYLKFTDISGSTPQELRAFAEQLESEGAKGVVLDLRKASPAGFHPTVLLADALLDGGIIGRVRSPDGIKTYRAEPDSLFRGWPMVVLAAGNAEAEVAWLCDALRDNHRATILDGMIRPLDPTVSEAVPVPGGEWSVRLATGRLERGEGQALGASDPTREAPRNFREMMTAATSGARTVPVQVNPANPANFIVPDQSLAKAIQVLTAALEAPKK